MPNLTVKQIGALVKLGRIALPPVSQTRITAKEDSIDFNLFRWIEIYGYNIIYPFQELIY